MRNVIAVKINGKFNENSFVVLTQLEEHAFCLLTINHNHFIITDKRQDSRLVFD